MRRAKKIGEEGETGGEKSNVDESKLNKRGETAEWEKTEKNSRI